jgi:aminopeptidase N
MFPFYMGINETKYAWMDEGWATIGEWIISPLIDSSIVDEYGVAPVSRNAGNETDMPIMTLSTETRGAYFYNSYPKPAMGYLYIKDYLGDALFTKALHHFIREWNGKHPLPNDFFYSMNTGSGKDLNWFWKRWFFETGTPDLAIGTVKNNGKNYTVTVIAKGTMPVPVDLTVHYNDGTQLKVHRTIGAWEKGARSVTLSFTAAKPVVKLVLGDPHTPDANIKDNTYEVK